MSEMPLTPDHLMVLGRGKVLADAPLGFRSRLDHTERQNSLARADEVARALRRETVSVTTLQDGALRFDGISASVKTHVGRVLAKLGARDRVQAVILAHKLGIVES